MNTDQFIKESIVKILDKMQKTREQKSVQEYGTLLDSLSHFTTNLKHEKENQVLAYFIEEELRKEQSGVSTLINDSIEKEEYKIHHKWSLVFHKLSTAIGSLKQNDYYIRMIKENVKGKYVFVSSREEKADANAIKYFENMGHMIDRHGNRVKIKINSNDYKVRAIGLIEFFGVEGDVLCVDREIGLRNYIKSIDPYVKEFKACIVV